MAIKEPPRRVLNVDQVASEGHAASPGKTLQPDGVEFASDVAKEKREALGILVRSSSVNWIVSKGKRSMVECSS